MRRTGGWSAGWHESLHKNACRESKGCRKCQVPNPTTNQPNLSKTSWEEGKGRVGAKGAQRDHQSCRHTVPATIPNQPCLPPVLSQGADGEWRGRDCHPSSLFRFAARLPPVQAAGVHAGETKEPTNNGRKGHGGGRHGTYPPEQNQASNE